MTEIAVKKAKQFKTPASLVAAFGEMDKTLAKVPQADWDAYMKAGEEEFNYEGVMKILESDASVKTKMRKLSKLP